VPPTDIVATQGELVVQTTDLKKSYGEGKAKRETLAGVDLTVAAGEFVCVLGLSGSGKSTLLGVIGGLDRHYTGTVELFGYDLSTLTDARLAALRGKRIGFVFQAFHLLPHLSVLDNVLAPGLFHDRGPELAESAREILERLGLGDRASDRPAQLSGGQRQRVAIARALLGEPDLLLCDEPTGNLDRETGARTIELFSELHRERELTVIAVTHEERLAEVSTRTLNLVDGQLHS
jgi:putative ABC transport system ATP-binding protein